MILIKLKIIHVVKLFFYFAKHILKTVLKVRKINFILFSFQFYGSMKTFLCASLKDKSF